MLIVAFTILTMSLSYMGGEMKRYFLVAIEAISTPELSGGMMWDVGKTGFFTMIRALAPIFIAGMVVAVLTGVIQVGGLFTMEPLTPKFEKLNPITGLKNMFKVVTVIELIKNIIKITIVLYMAYKTIYKSLDDVMRTYRISILDSAVIAGGIIAEFIVKVCILFIFISLIDYMIQRWNFMKNMRMSKDEVKREWKQEEGDPNIKGERRRLHREMAFGDVKKAVKKSDVVVTNPVHLAIAIEYDRENMGAPQVVAKGQEEMAGMIVEIARQEKIPIQRNIPLAWSLIHLEVGDEIPEELYEAVAEVLTVIYELKEAAAQSPESEAPLQ